jgi:hypothetical protein
MWCLYLDIRSPLPTGRAWVHSRYEVGRALSLVAECLDDCEVSLRTGISRRTILDSRHGRAPHASGTRTAPEVLAPAANLDRSTNPPTRTYWVSIWRRLALERSSHLPTAHRSRPEVSKLDRARDHVDQTSPRWEGHGRHLIQVGCIEICASWQHWPCPLFRGTALAACRRATAPRSLIPPRSPTRSR